MYSLIIQPGADKEFSKLDSHIIKRIQRKINQILKNPYQFKPLQKPLQNKRRVQVGSYVLVFSINEKKKQVIIWRYRHHDKIYKS